MTRPYYLDPRWDSEDPYIRAVIRSRAITAGLADVIEGNRRGAYWVDMESVLRGGPVLYAATHDDPSRAGQPIPTDGLGKWSDARASLTHLWDAFTPSFGPDHPLRDDEPENMKRFAHGDR